ncbi:MAG: hypothetical protein WCP70_06100 [Methanothrix sp.]
MRLSTKTVAMVISLYLILGLVGASEYQFGTKVLAVDKDIGRPLFAMPATTDIRFWDTGVVPGYDDTDVVYIKVLPGFFSTANDLRLTPFGNLPAGSKVTPVDNDIGMPLAFFPPTKAIRFLNLFGSPLYDLMDPVYFSQAGPNSVVNDVRLNATVGTGLKPGTKVHDFEPDLNLVFGAPISVTFPGPGLCFFDVNGNGVYDYWDDVYMNVPSGFPAEVSVNNIRLSGPV